MEQQYPDLSQYLVSIPFDPNVGILPIADLHLAGGYGRVPYFPQDIIPTLGLVTLFGNNPPNLLRDSNQAGAADVYVVNESGGGGGGLAPQDLIHNISNAPSGGINPSTMHQLDYTTAAAKYLLGVTATIHMRPAQFTANVGGLFRIGLSVDGVTFLQTLFQGYFGPYATVPPTDYGNNIFTYDMAFPMGIDIQASYPGGTGVGLYSFCTAGDYSAGGCLIYSSGP